MAERPPANASIPMTGKDALGSGGASAPASRAASEAPATGSETVSIVPALPPATGAASAASSAVASAASPALSGLHFIGAFCRLVATRCSSALAPRAQRSPAGLAESPL